MISMVVALYNDRGRFEKHSVRLREYLNSLAEPWEMILVDDGSNDGTFEFIRSLSLKDNRIRGFRLSKNHGQGAALKLGFLRSRGDTVLYTDADLPIPLPFIKTLIDRVRSGSDIAVGARWVKGADITVPQPLIRRKLGLAYYALIRAVLMPDIEDCNCGLKAYRGELARVLFGYVRCWRWAFNIEHLWLAQRSGCTISQVPVEWAHDPGSKVHMFRDCLFTLWELLGIQLRRVLGIYPRFEELT